MSSLDVNRKHIVIAFLCPKNCAMTMFENKCDEQHLLQHPELLLTHYFRYSGIDLSDQEKKELFSFLKTRCGEQFKDALLCPLNRHATRQVLDCDDSYFLKDHNYNKLINHYIANGGATAYAVKKAEPERELAAV